MRKVRSLNNLEPFDPEIERTLRELRARRRKEVQAMENNNEILHPPRQRAI